MIPPVAFAVVYVVVDAIYVAVSHRVYLDTVRAIQKGARTTFDASRAVAALGAYTLMAIGWLVLVAPAIRARMRDGAPPLWAGIFTGFTFGIMLHGVFNLTNYAMFQNYSSRVIIQDMLWGSTWVTVVSVAFAYYLHRNAGSHTHRH